MLEGSGVSFLSSSNIPMSSVETEASFPETGYGYVPDSGCIFLLSRLSGEMGAFLALTGYKLVTWDLVALGLTKELMAADPEHQLVRHVSYNNFNISLNSTMEKWPEVFKNYHKNENVDHKFFDVLNLEDRKKLEYFSSKESFELPWERKEGFEKEKIYSSQLDYLVSKEFEKDSNEKKFNFRDYKERKFTNTHDNFMISIYGTLPVVPLGYFSLAHVVKDINRLFRFNTVNEILEALKLENSTFADWCVNQIEYKSPLALEVTLRMLRNAMTLNYYEILKQEINVAKNMILNNKDFDLFMENKLSYSKKRVKYPGSLSSIKKEDVDKMFNDANILNKIKLDVKENAMLPLRLINKEYPDCFSLWINENQRVNSVIRSFFDYEVKHFLIHKL
jgi:enoyl-CoA hydratase/carnithine racemase